MPSADYTCDDPFPELVTTDRNYHCVHKGGFGPFEGEDVVTVNDTDYPVHKVLSGPLEGCDAITINDVDCPVHGGQLDLLKVVMSL